MMNVTTRSLCSQRFSWLVFLLPVCAWGQCPGTYTVSNNSGDPTVAGSLPYEVTAAEACPGSTVNITATGTIILINRILLNTSINIVGPGEANLTISGGGTTRIFFVGTGTTAAFSSPVTINISGLTLADGYGVGGSAVAGGGAAGMGGAIFQNGGALNLTNVAFTGNIAQGGGYGSEFTSGTGGGGFGGNSSTTEMAVRAAISVELAEPPRLQAQAATAAPVRGAASAAQAMAVTEVSAAAARPVIKIHTPETAALGLAEAQLPKALPALAALAARTAAIATLATSPAVEPVSAEPSSNTLVPFRSPASASPIIPPSAVRSSPSLLKARAEHCLCTTEHPQP